MKTLDNFALDPGLSNLGAWWLVLLDYKSSGVGCFVIFRFVKGSQMYFIKCTEYFLGAIRTLDQNWKKIVSSKRFSIEIEFYDLVDITFKSNEPV